MRTPAQSSIRYPFGLCHPWLSADSRSGSRLYAFRKARTKLERLSYPALRATTSIAIVVVVKSIAACRILKSRKMTIGDCPKMSENRAMNAERLNPALCAKLWTEWAAPGRATISAKARVTCLSASIENRSVHRWDDLRDRRTNETTTCLSREAVMAPTPISCCSSSSMASRSFRSILSAGSNCSITGSRSSPNSLTD